MARCGELNKGFTDKLFGDRNLALGYYGIEARPLGGGWRKPFVR